MTAVRKERERPVFEAEELGNKRRTTVILRTSFHWEIGERSGG